MAAGSSPRTPLRCSPSFQALRGARLKLGSSGSGCQPPLSPPAPSSTVPQPLWACCQLLLSGAWTPLQWPLCPLVSGLSGWLTWGAFSLLRGFQGDGLGEVPVWLPGEHCGGAEVMDGPLVRVTTFLGPFSGPGAVPVSLTRVTRLLTSHLSMWALSLAVPKAETPVDEGGSRGIVGVGILASCRHPLFQLPACRAGQKDRALVSCSPEVALPPCSPSSRSEHS